MPESWDFDAITKQPNPPYIKVRIRDSGDHRETPWAIDLGDGLAMLANTPLYPKYRYGDVVRVPYHPSQITEVGEIVQRTFPVMLRYTYTPADTDEADKVIRQALLDAVKPFKCVPGFWTKGSGYVLLAEGVDENLIFQALTGAASVPDVWEERFDASTDEYNNRKLPTPRFD